MGPGPRLSRAGFLRLLAAGAGALLLPGAIAAAAVARMRTRPIPATGAALPVVGCGTWQVFDVAGTPAERARLRGVLDALFAAGGSVIDTSPMYGRAEARLGELLEAGGDRGRAFLATKVWITGREHGIAQMDESLRLLRTDRVELMQVHNLVDTRVHWPVLQSWKEKGKVRHLGLTHYTEAAYAQLEAEMQALRPDFVQLDYSVAARAAERRLLPLAAGLGVAVIVNQPFGGGGLLRALAGKPLPGFAAELDCRSWAQLLLKFVLGHPAVTCVIPGTGKAEHMVDNAAAGTGPVLDEAQRARIAAAFAAAT
jgi:aryl-alcohol dehydrogenase-like predicted oxidoreductase